MSVYIYRSTDASAPALTGWAGSLIAVLDACLVNGYGSKAPVGWTKPWSGTNLASYRSNVGSQLYVGVDDGAGTTARIRGFQTMTAAGVAAGSGAFPFPSDVQVSGGLWVIKSNAASSLARPWVLISNGKIFYLFIDLDTTDTHGTITAFGDISSYKASDSNCSILIANTTGSYANCYFPVLSNVSSTIAGHYLSQKFDGISYSISVGKVPINGWLSHDYMSGWAGFPLIQDPEPIAGGKILSPIGISEMSGSFGVPRGRLPGIWAAAHAVFGSTGDTIQGDPNTALAGKTVELFKIYNVNATLCMCLIETSDTWDLINFK